MPPNTDAVTIMAPLLFIVVLELSSIGRDVDLPKAMEQERYPLGLPFLRPIFPPFGRFNFVHGANLVVLTSGLLLITLLGGQWVRWGTSFMAWIVLIILPVLEVEEYGRILSENAGSLSRFFYSFHVHLLLASVLTLYVVIWGKTIPQNPTFGLTHPMTLIPFFPVLIILMAISYLGFMQSLAKELEQIEPSDRKARITPPTLTR